MKFHLLIAPAFLCSIARTGKHGIHEFEGTF